MMVMCPTGALVIVTFSRGSICSNSSVVVVIVFSITNTGTTQQHTQLYYCSYQLICSVRRALRVHLAFTLHWE